MLNKTKLTYEEVVQFYKKSYNQDSTISGIFNRKMLTGTLIVIVLIVLGYVIYRKYPRRLIQIKK